eukprot:TRINITY_DN8447_c0_g1_i1.p1 TRINITY_DN8447_c0_g1~~TRINITY_DN8447_c0_g1_i1.p1  ORF type:complete len:492 (-),score=67.47 TRINITY_DN8447_c0_g1_i1:32-1486(-)
MNSDSWTHIPFTFDTWFFADYPEDEWLFSCSNPIRWVCESGKNDVDVSYEHIDNICRYNELDQEYLEVFACEVKVGEDLLVFMVLFETRSKDKRKAIVFNHHGTVRFYCENSYSSPKEELKNCLNKGFKTPPPFSDLKYRKAKLTVELDRQIREFEEAPLVPEYKFGVIFAKAGQHSLGEILSNNDSNCNHFNKFLSLLGDLENGDEKHLRYIRSGYGPSPSTLYVSTFLNSGNEDPELMVQKKYILSNLVNIVYQEPGTKLDTMEFPNSLKTNIFIFIEPVLQDRKASHYKIGMACRSHLNPFGPFVKNPPLYTPQEMRNFLFEKLFNGYNICLHSPPYKERMEHVRATQLFAQFKSLTEKRSVKIRKTSNRERKSASMNTEKKKRSKKRLSLANIIPESVMLSNDIAEESESNDREFIFKLKYGASQYTIFCDKPPASIKELLGYIGTCSGMKFKTIKLRGITLRDSHVSLLRENDILKGCM